MKIVKHPTADIVYNSTTALWACCYGSGSLDCSVPSAETFEEPSPQQLLADFASSSFSSSPSSSTSLSSKPASLVFTSSSSVSTAFSSSTASSAPTSSTSSRLTVCPSGSACSPHPSTGLSAGVKAGIGIAAALVGIALAVLAFLCFHHRRKRHYNHREQSEQKPGAGINGNATQHAYAGAAEINAKRSVELDSNARVEMNAASGNRWEMQ